MFIRLIARDVLFLNKVFMKIGSFFCWLSRICYANKLKGWNSSSGRKIPSSVFRWLVLLGVMCIMPWQGAMGSFMKDRHYYEWNPKTGCIHYSVRYFQTWGASNSGWEGMGQDENPGGFKIGQTIGSDYTEFLIACSDSKGNLSMHNGISTYDDKQKDYPEDGEDASKTYKWECEKRIIWDQPVSESNLNKKATIQMSGVWWREGGSSDEDVNVSYSIPLTVTLTSFEAPSYTYEYPNLLINWSRSTSGNCATLGNLYLYENGSKTQWNGNTYIEECIASTGSFSVNVTDKFWETAHKFKVHQQYDPTLNSSLHYIKESDEVVIKAFPQVSELSLTPLMDEKKVVVSWKIPTAPGEDYINTPFLVNIKRVVGYDTINIPLGLTRTHTYYFPRYEAVLENHKVNYVKDQTSYSYDLILEDGDTSTYVVSVEREMPNELKDWAGIYVKTNSIEVNTAHCYPQDYKVELKMDENNRPYAEITWGQSGSKWTEGTKMKIKRTNITLAKEDEWVFGKDGYEAQIFKDRLLQPCTRYLYSICLEPGGSYSKLDTMLSDTIKVLEVGSVSDLEASKGYYSDKVNLTWKIEPEIDAVLIERREYEDGNAPFMYIGSVNASAGSIYSYDDATCLPGVVYEYRIYGMKKCDESNIYVDTLSEIGFRTPTGDFYGHVTFENGQAVDSVRVRLESDEVISSYALGFTGTGKASIPNLDIINNGSFSLQAWVMPKEIDKDSIVLIQKDNTYRLTLDSGYVSFAFGNKTIKSSKALKVKEYTHVSAIYDESNRKLLIYLNGDLSSSEDVSDLEKNIDVKGNVVIGENFVGQIDEVRMWSRALNKAEISNDYMRYLVGNEDGLVAYYTFNFITSEYFFDSSHDGTDHYHGNTGTLSGVSKEPSSLNTNHLSYCAVTDSSGVYTIRAVPYYGNGTAYTIIPSKGNHQFSPKQEIRFIGEGAQHHTVNFTDNSSFKVSGNIYYSGGEYPVEGAHFTIDGVIALDNKGQYVKTGAKGEFSIYVPVGIHEVKAVKDGHTFELDGRICNSDGSDRNYQDIMTKITLYDNTKVKYIGRICGGEVQEAYPVGFSLSKNNMAKDMKIVLKPTQAVPLQGNAHQEKVTHPILKGVLARNPKAKALQTTVDYNTEDITIHVNNETGEFIAWVFPIDYTISLSVYGHEEISGDNSSLNLSTYKVEQFEKYEYVDSVYTNGIDDTKGYERKPYVDSVFYTQKQVFTKRYTAQMEVVQVDENGKKMPYFGDDKAESTNVMNEKESVQLWSESTGYSLGYPVFSTGSNYTFVYNVFEEYPYYINSKKEVDSTKTDRVEVEPTNVSFNNKMAILDSIDVENYTYTFKAGEPSITSPIGTIAATFTYGSSDNPTSVAWINPLGNDNGMAYVLGAHKTGSNFVTAGPDKLLCVLRDPPGSNSYSYLEKGVTFSEQSTYSGSISNEGSEDFTMGVQVRTQQITVVGVGTAVGTANTLAEIDNGATIGVSHSEEYTGNNSSKTTVTTTTRFQTSDDPLYVGANGDLYVGYSTNITFGTSQNVLAVSRATYDSLGGESAYEKTYLVTDSLAVVQSNGITVGQSFGTLFAYPQVHIEQVLIPTLEELRNSLLLLPKEADSSKLQAKANKDSVNYYYSFVNADDEHFGMEGYYKAYLSNSVEGTRDTIEALNTYIEDWRKALSNNDSIKATVIKNEKLKLQNYSFHAGANVEYSEQYSTTVTSNHSFSITIGGKISNDSYLGTAATKTKFEFEESVATTQGGEFENELEASHSKGFVLAEDGDDDYLSVDVFREKNKNESYEIDGVNSGSVDENSLIKKSSYSTFVFSTKGGATGCPYEGAYKATHWKGHENELISAATMKLENPKIDMPTKFVENVPSGEDAYLTVYLKNDSETGEDQWFDLRFVDATNPYGAVPSIDGNSMSGFALEYLVPAGQVLEKTLAVTKGSVLNYDNMAIALCSKCQADPTSFLDVISDTVYFSVHFIPSCSDVAIVKPSNNWTYNTNCAVDTIDGVAKHYMPITISGFDVNYTDFEHIELQYKSASGSDKDWTTLGYYYKDSTMAKNAVANGFNAFLISSEDAGNIYYNFYMDDMPDQKYDLRAVSYCNINNELYENPSEVISGIKDMYNPRLFGSPKPANGILTVDDDIRIDFNETIAEGMLTVNNFEITGVRNGAVTDHSVAISLDGKNDYLTTEVTRNFANKDLTFECWVNIDTLRKSTFFSHGDASASISMGMDKKGKIVVKVGDKSVVSEEVPAWEKSSWNHVALVYDNEDKTVTAYVNYKAVINAVEVNAYNGNGIVEVGRDVATQSNNFYGKVDQFRIWNAVRSSATIQANSTSQLSGNDLNLIAYYEMEEAKGTATEDKARGANLIMKGGTWALPEGRSASFDGSNYMELNSSAAVITSDMDFTLEFWFNAKENAKSQTILSNGNGIDNVGEDPAKLFSVGFDEQGTLVFNHNGYATAIEGNYADNNWHNFTLAVNRASGNARIYVDGTLNTYFSADKVGMIASDKLYAGARVWHEEKSVKKTVDQYFTGEVDEIRLWNLYRQQSQVESFYNQKSNGDESGLLLYYPFEHYIKWQGTNEMQFTLNNMVNMDTTATAVGNVNGVTNIPPVKGKGAVASLAFDWVVNNDALIISLQEQDYRIEKTIVNFTVNRVQDVNGNYIVSPITWSAYIDRNQLKWMDDAVTVNKKQNEPYQFEMPIVNKGGSVINYSLKDMPSWLSASTESGSINPLEKQTIEFEIDPSLAVGTYDEVVYLTNSNNVTEPLTLNVTVEGDTPDWSVDPSKFEFSMAVFAQIKLDNQFSNDEKDMLAAFYNGECVGVANMSYDKTMDLWYAMMTVYSKDSKSHDLVYRTWDASKGLMSEAVASQNVSFVSDTVYGKPTEPIVFSNGKTRYQNIPLSKGWNWVSFNLANKKGMADINTYLSSGEWGSNSIVKTLSAPYANYSTATNQWMTSGIKLNNTNMFKIYSDIDQTLSVSGSDINLDSTKISVKAKSWNYIAYLPTGSMTLKTALADYQAKDGDVIKSNEGFAMYYGNEWIGSLKSLQPNCGYMLKNTGDSCSFRYPSSSSALRASVSVKSSAYESNMSIIASAPEKREGDVLHALVGNEENKVVEVALTNDLALQFINVSANAGDKVRFTMERDGVIYEADNTLTFTGDAIYGSPNHPYMLNFNVGGIETLTVYPNPVVDEMNVAGRLDGEGDVTLELFDVVGALIFEKQISTSNNVLDESINVSGLIPGSYVLKISQNDESKVFKVVKK